MMVFAQAEAPAAATTAEAPAQTATTATEVAPAGADGAAPAAPPKQGGFGMLVPMLVIFGIFYFMMIRPQQRKEKERRKMIEELRAGAKVVFAGGFIGTIKEAREKTFLIEIAPGVSVEVARASVSGVAEEPAPAAK
jgi:preprotein translocase subunit YajC